MVKELQLQLDPLRQFGNRKVSWADDDRGVRTGTGQAMRTGAGGLRCNKFGISEATLASEMGLSED